MLWCLACVALADTIEYVAIGPSNAVCGSVANKTLPGMGGLTSETYLNNFLESTNPSTFEKCVQLVPPNDMDVKLEFFRKRIELKTNLYDPFKGLTLGHLNLLPPTFDECNHYACLPGPCLLYDMDYLYDSMFVRDVNDRIRDKQKGKILMTGVPRCGPFFGAQIANANSGTTNNIIPSSIDASTRKTLITKYNVTYGVGSRSLPVRKGVVNGNPLWYYKGIGDEQRENRQFDRNHAPLVCGKTSPYGEAHSRSEGSPWGYNPTTGQRTLFGNTYEHFPHDTFVSIVNSNDGKVPTMQRSDKDGTTVEKLSHVLNNCDSYSGINDSTCIPMVFPPNTYRVPQLVPGGNDQSIIDDTHTKLFGVAFENTCDLTQCDYVPDIDDDEILNYLACTLLELVLLHASTSEATDILQNENYRNAFPPSCFSEMLNFDKTAMLNANNFTAIEPPSADLDEVTYTPNWTSSVTEYVTKDRTLDLLLTRQDTWMEHATKNVPTVPGPKPGVEPINTCPISYRHNHPEECCYGFTTERCKRKDEPKVCGTGAGRTGRRLCKGKGVIHWAAHRLTIRSAQPPFATKHHRAAHRLTVRSARCSVLSKNLHSSMPLVPTLARLKLLHTCDQWHSFRVFTHLAG